MRYSIVRLDTFHDAIGPERFEECIQEYRCSKDIDVENYLKNSAMHHTKHDVSKTFLAIDTRHRIIGYYTLAIKCLSIPELAEESEISRTFCRNINVHEGVVQAYLIGQLSRADYSFKGLGTELLDIALANLNRHRTNIGCNAVRLDCRDSMVEYYRNRGFRFVKTDQKTGLSQMISMLK